MAVTGRMPCTLLMPGCHTCLACALPAQVLLSLPSFTSDLKLGRQQLEAARQPLSSSGVFSALLDCVTAKEGASG
jgi:hypothetical protein